jgi:hypothetical protein
VNAVSAGDDSALRPDGRLCDVSKLLIVLLAVLVLVEVIAVIGVAGALFWVGGRGTVVVGASMLVVALVAGILALRSMRPRR